MLPSVILTMYEKSQEWLAEVIIGVSAITGIIDEDKKRKINEPPLQHF